MTLWWNVKLQNHWRLTLMEINGGVMPPAGFFDDDCLCLFTPDRCSKILSELFYILHQFFGLWSGIFTGVLVSILTAIILSLIHPKAIWVKVKAKSFFDLWVRRLIWVICFLFFLISALSCFLMFYDLGEGLECEEVTMILTQSLSADHLQRPYISFHLSIVTAYFKLLSVYTALHLTSLND